MRWMQSKRWLRCLAGATHPGSGSTASGHRSFRLLGLSALFSAPWLLLVVPGVAEAGQPRSFEAVVLQRGQELPVALTQRAGRQLVLLRQQRQLLFIEDGRVERRFPAAVGMPGWETPAGSFAVMEKRADPVWQHPESGQLSQAGPANPLGSRWIGFQQDCSGRKGWDGERHLDVKGCVVMGFHGTPHRWTVGRAVSHGCVRLYDEDVRTLYDLVEVGTPVTVLP